MPLGNGDIGLNVWVESNGDINFYISKTDAWSEDNFGPWGLLKLGKVRIALYPQPEINPFVQVLKLYSGEIQVKEGNSTFRIWVDANNPVIRIESKNKYPSKISVELNNWRRTDENKISADTILSGLKDKIEWYHRNASTANPHLTNLTFGAIIKGEGLVSENDTVLVSSKQVKTDLISIYPLTAKTESSSNWKEKLDQQVVRIDDLKLEKTRQAHRQWWGKFWHRSWVFVRGDSAANDITQGYILQRFVTACSGRGAYPIKFNGSIFTVDNPALIPVGGKEAFQVNADYRVWGGQYWFQNTRAMYWPRLQAGDFDVMLPLFNMYANMLPENSKKVLEYYKHEGAYFAETKPFWGGLAYAGPEVKEDWTLHYFTPILELSMMMLDYYEYTGDVEFAKKTLIPVASAGLTFFDKHFTRDGNGKLLLDPDNAIEMYWKVHDPAPDIAGLMAVLKRMISLPDNLVSNEMRTAWTNFLEQIPPLPVGEKDGKKVLLPYTGPQTAQFRNSENPELYAVYPFRLYGLEKPGLDLAVNTFNARKCTFKGCWTQDPVQSAMLGLSGVAKSYIYYNFTCKDPRLKFPAFWIQKNDYAPDQDNGGNGENGLQQMIMQTDGKKIFLLPAWPAGWEGDFKMNAPFNTSVQGTIQNGRVSKLIVIPQERKADIVNLSSVIDN
jgi:hypothetical protein